jgi:DNA polymerase
MDNAAALKELEKEIAADAALPFWGNANTVFGEGDPAAPIMFIGEAPGANEDRLRRPFVGRSGKLLDEMIRSIGWRREDMYITNIVKRRPPENRDPLPAEIGAYRPYLARQIAIVDPALIVTLGRFAMHYFAPDAKMTRDHGSALLCDGRTVFPVYHPAAALRSAEMRKALLSDFAKIPEILAARRGIS